MNKSLRFSLARHLPNLCDAQFRINPRKQPRQRLFTTRSFFLTMLHLVADSEKSSALQALLKTFTTEAKRSFPSKSAFCQLRKKVSYTFFKEVFAKLCSLCSESPAAWNGLKVVAIDGMQLQLPRGSDIVKRGFTGRKTSRHSESYMPRGYMVMAFDVLGGFILKYNLNSTLNEIKDAVAMLPKFPKKTLFLYDRLYFSKKILRAHKAHGSYFVARLKRNASKEVMSFFPSKRQFTSMNYLDHTLYLIKVKTPKGVSVYATNLSRYMFTRSEIRDLYKLRWQIETCFYDLSTTCHLERWHAKSYNLILQEMYMRLWVFNATRLLTHACQPFSKVGMRVYKRANFRLVLAYVRDSLHLYWSNFSKLYPGVKQLVDRFSETRKVDSRLNPREIKSPRSPYKYRSCEWQWEKKYA